MTDTTAVEVVGAVPSNNNGVAVPITDTTFTREISTGIHDNENNGNYNCDEKRSKRAAAEEHDAHKKAKSRKTSVSGASRPRIKEEAKADSDTRQCRTEKEDESNEEIVDEDEEEEEEDEIEDDGSSHGEAEAAENQNTLLSSNQLLEHHQQLLQSYAQANSQDLANLTASSLAQAMVSPIAVPGLTSNLLQQLQSGNVITALPGPPPQIPSQASNMQTDSLSEDGQTKRGPNVRNMSNDERRQRRLLRNRVAAKECRKKKKQYIQDMEEQITRLKEENARLHKEVDELNTKLTLGVGVGSESYRLMKEVVELNAKLGMNLSSGSSQLTDAVMAAVQQHQQHQQQQSQPTKPDQPQPQQQSSSSSSPQPSFSRPPPQSSTQPSPVPLSETKDHTQPDGNKFNEISSAKHASTV